MVQINYRPTYYADIDRVCRDMQTNANKAERFLEDITDTSSKIVQPINLIVSFAEPKRVNARIKLSSVISDLKDIFDDIEGLGEFPPGYEEVRGSFDEWFGEPDLDNQDRYRNPDDYKRDIERIADNMSGNGDRWGWADWANEAGYPDLAAKIKKTLGKITAMFALVTVSYSEKVRTITLYRWALEDPNTKDGEEQWVIAFISGLFYAYLYDSRTNPNSRPNNKLMQSFASYIQYVTCEDVLTNPSRARQIYRTWRTCDMQYWPYSGALYFHDIHIRPHSRRFHRNPEHYLFIRTFKKSLSNMKAAYDDLKSMYRTVEGYAFK